MTPDCSLLRLMQHACKEHVLLRVHDPHARIDDARTLRPQAYASCAVEFQDAGGKQDFMRAAHAVAVNCSALADELLQAAAAAGGDDDVTL